MQLDGFTLHYQGTTKVLLHLVKELLNPCNFLCQPNRRLATHVLLDGGKQVALLVLKNPQFALQTDSLLDLPGKVILCLVQRLNAAVKRLPKRDFVLQAGLEGIELLLQILVGLGH